MNKTYRGWASRLCLALAVLLALGGGSGAAVAAAPQAAADEFKLVTLGDSITAGFEPGVDYSKAQPYGYADRLYEQGLLHGRTSLSNYGIVGLKTSGLKVFSEAAAAGKGVTGAEIQENLPDPRADVLGASAAALRAELAEADAVVITIGGNDFSPLLTKAAELTEDQLKAEVAALLTQYNTNVTASVDALLSVNPALRIIIADQYQPVPVLGGKDLYNKLNLATAAFTANLDTLAASYAAKGSSVEAAHVAKEFVGREGMLTYMVSKRDFHPNQSGYAVIAAVFGKVLWGAYTELAAPAAGAPMNIYVGGKLLNTPYKPVLKNDVNYVAIQDIVNAVGAKTVWDSKTSTANIKYGTRTVGVRIGSPTVTVDGIAVPVSSPAYMQKIGKEGKTYVPLATVAEGLGFSVEYKGKLKSVFINP
ncbi:stalk domain-containing protein [Paenibacillus pasadenensis]|uniref:stalk domain-containing protein n=1 Tax=Paenibacillus pasadenensis TaxID=217090 RepID=UPI00203B1893|nr:stalk domain-containing protein [Paenibacillus pasadenensis]MCM3747627.1 stalk domain-containing protein [Paenibacillus pasadenensis]